MRRRVMMGKRELVEVVEELKSSGTWMVPAGCKFVDVFIVGGGGSGASSGPKKRWWRVPIINMVNSPNF